MKVFKLFFGITIYYPVSIHIPLPALKNNIENKKMVLGFRGFKRLVNLDYEKRLRKGTREILEYYSNGQLWMYSEVEEEKDSRITNTYGPKGDLFAINKVFFDHSRKIIKEYDWVLNEDGSISEGTTFMS